MSVNTKLTSISQVRELLQTLGIRPSRAMGQNFLVDANVLRIITQAAELTPDDNVLEIGGGLGVMTEALVQQAGKVVVRGKRFSPARGFNRERPDAKTSRLSGGYD